MSQDYVESLSANNLSKNINFLAEPLWILSFPLLLKSPRIDPKHEIFFVAFTTWYHSFGKLDT